MKTLSVLTRTTFVGVLLTLVFASPVFAWNALGHKTIAEIAWRQLDPEQRQAIVNTLRRHPRFDADFAGKMPDETLQADKATQDRWIFQQAATWPDIAREVKGDDRMVWDWPAWHYVNIPQFLDPSDKVLAPELTFNHSPEYPTLTERKEFNVMQALAHTRRVLDSRAGPDIKALAYCWVFHLVGDVHQPLHSTALVSANQLPKGDRGGNKIPLRRGQNLHSLWDNLLGRPYYMRDVDRAVADLSDRQRFGDVWNTAAQETDVRKWVAESHNIAESVVYADAILNAVRNTPVGEQIAPIELPEAYFRRAGEVARHRVLAAGIRLGELLGGKSADRQDAKAEAQMVGFEPASLVPATSRDRSATQSALDHWLNTSTGVRHNRSCRWYGETKGGRYCTEVDGKPCGQCGG